MTDKEDHWVAKDYINNAAFVPKLTSVLVDDFLRPQPTDTILDIGCGDGALTSRIPCNKIYGVDSSASLLEVARTNHGLNVMLLDGRDLNAKKVVSEFNNGIFFDKVMSNAALHWVLNTRDRENEAEAKLNAGASSSETQLLGDTIRQNFFNQVFASLKSGVGAVFAAEMGGLGNVAEIHTAFLATLARYGMTPAEAQRVGASPWFFPHEDTIRNLLEIAGFVVEKIERVYRSTPLPHGNKGLLEWIKLFGFSFVDAFEKFQERKNVPAAERVSSERFLQEVCDLLTTICYDPQDSKQAYAGYVRLRWRAIKP
ncbi:uncharacterized protein SAPINGB_P000882 [Magnusiomyces paraingens]|uniref:Methyltransferase type 11 domain-containing protein n=1 Tax=Magnusiomyces paraingens TaxID=2606893 RepID=A0A5E8B3G5_9ASCO|nr:uncharacterized protein SAPINGB_P000882 [Saprochaete ingens]VVT45770.1 unnamed protein product [Saprochaete ingens]